MSKGRRSRRPYAQGRPLATTEAGGTQRLGSAFVQDTLRVNDRLTLVFGAHGDGWRSTSAAHRVRQIVGIVQSARVGLVPPRRERRDRSGRRLSRIPGADAQRVLPQLRLRNTQTRPNEALDPERLTGGDAGVLIEPRPASARVTGFWNVLDEAITAITLSSTPQLIIRQRANADTLRATGIEMEGDVRLPASLSVAFSSGFVSSRFTGDTALRGKRVPQVPEYNLGLDVRYAPRRLDRVGPAARHRTAVRGRPERLHAAPRHRARRVRRPDACRARSPRSSRSKTCSMPPTTSAARRR